MIGSDAVPLGLIGLARCTYVYGDLEAAGTVGIHKGPSWPRSSALVTARASRHMAGEPELPVKCLGARLSWNQGPEGASCRNH